MKKKIQGRNQEENFKKFTDFRKSDIPFEKNNFIVLIENEIWSPGSRIHGIVSYYAPR
jgi:hypothetical protein